MSRAGSIVCLRSPKEGIKDTWHETQGKVLYNHSCTKLPKLNEIDHQGSDRSKRLGLENAEVRHKRHPVCMFRQRIRHSTLGLLSVFTEVVLFDGQKSQKVKL